MNKGTGLAVSFAVAVGAVRLLGGGSAPAPAPSPRPIAPVLQATLPQTAPTKKAQNPHPAPKAPVTLGGCAAYTPDTDTPLKTYPQKSEKGAADSLLQKFFQTQLGQPLAPGPSVRVAIALAPDPRHTQLSTIFDREMAALQQAAQDESYVYTSSWMPWTSDSATYSRVDDSQLSDDLTADRESCPGILLFRKYAATTAHANDLSATASYNTALLVFVVGEQPTGGLNRTQWANAIDWIGHFAPAARSPLLVVGPTFSGSVVSLDRELHALPAASFPKVQVLSGAVSSRTAVDWFLRQVAMRKSSQPTALAQQVNFGTFQENDDLQIERFLTYWGKHGSRRKDTAILSEDETVYGFGDTAIAPPCAPNDPDDPNDPCVQPLRLYFPRDLSALRLQYQKESVFSTGSPAGERAVHSVLQDGAEPPDASHSGTDTIPSYSGDVTPLAQEALLYGIVTELRAHHSRFVLLRCTNPLDFLFLTRFLHRAYPEGRIVLVGQDLLLRREIDTTEFRGVMGLTNYPLLPRDEHWSLLTAGTTTRPHTHLVFESPLAEGTYLAARYTFGGDSPLTDSSSGIPLTFWRKDALPGYASPFWLHAQPEANTSAPTWLTVVGREGFWPVAVLNDQTNALNPATFPSTLVQLIATPCMSPIASNLDLPRPWNMAALCVIGLFAYQFYGLFKKKEFASTGLFSIFRPGDTPSQQVLLGIGCALTCLLLTEVASISLTLHAANLLEATPNATAVWFVKWLAWLAPLGLIAFLAWSQPPVLRRISIATQLLLAASIWWLWHATGLLMASNAAAAVPLFYRMGHLNSGVSPLLPVLLLTGGFYLGMWQAMAGNHLLGNGAPCLPVVRHQSSPPGSVARFLTRTHVTCLWNSFVGYRNFVVGPPAPDDPDHTATVSPIFVRVSHTMARRILYTASPLSFPVAVWVPALVVGSAIWLLFRGEFLLIGIEGRAFTTAINLALVAGLLLTLTESSRFYLTWNELHRLLNALGRLRLRRTFTRLRAVPQSSLWGVSGRVQAIQHSFFSQQWDAACRLRNHFGFNLASVLIAVKAGEQFQRNGLDKFSAGLDWTRPVQIIHPTSGNPTTIRVRDAFNDTAADLLTFLQTKWRDEDASLVLETGDIKPAPKDDTLSMPLCTDPLVQTAEEFVCLHYIAFIQIILARMRTMVLSMTCLFVAVCLAISFYPFVPRTQIAVWMMANLALIAFTVIYVYAGMERDETLSYITNTPPGRLGTEFWLKTAAFLAGPVLGLLTTQFPAIADSILGWLQPGLSSLK